jgi:ribonucleoside-diphosphate reductase alpha chain
MSVIDIEREYKRIQYFNGDDLALNVWKDKYKYGEEITPDDMHLRMAKEFARVDANYQIDELKNSINSNQWQFLSEYGSTRKDLTTKSIYKLFKKFRYIVPQGSIMSQCGNNEQIGSLSNCFVIGQPEDSYGGILLKDQELVQLMKRRGGVGIDISTLRPDRTPTSNAAKTSTGAVSFMERFSNSTREVAQNGRRGALMLSIDVRHPDVADFVTIKNDRTKVTGANISVSLRDDFMEAVKKDEDYLLRYPIDGETIPVERVGLPYNTLHKYDDVWIKKIRAKELYELIIENAWDNAEPGQIFIDRHWNYSPDGIYPQYKGITTNPCGEIFMQPYDACRLMAINLYSFVDNKFTNKASINYEKLYRVAYEQQRLADNLVDLELEKIDRILAKVNKDPESEESRFTEQTLWERIRKVAASGRRTGCGFTGLGDMVAAMGVGYDSEEGMKIIDEVMKIKMKGELDCTIDLAVLRGPFEGFDHKIELGKEGSGSNDFYKFIKKTFKNQFDRMRMYGRRNVSWSTVAPTGSVSILTQTTSGLEPVFSIFPYLRRKKLNPQDIGVRVDFTDESGDQWQEFSVTHKGLMDYIRANESNEHPIIKIYDKMDKSKLEEEELVAMVVDFINDNETPYSNSSANDINWISRVEIQSIIQKYTTHSISSTINLPNDVSKEEVSEIYIKSWDKNLKGVTIYRDGCRTGVLVTKTESNEDEIMYNDAPKRPKDLECEIFHPRVKGQIYTVIIGLLKGKVYEVFATDEEIGKGYSEAINKKVKSGHYSLITRDGKEMIHDNLGSGMTDEEEMFTRALSGALRHGMHVKYGVEMCNNGKGDITSFTKVIARTLKRYIEDGTASHKKCGDCGAVDSMIYEEGCSRCKICGSSKCG